MPVFKADAVVLQCYPMASESDHRSDPGPVNSELWEQPSGKFIKVVDEENQLARVMQRSTG